MKRLHRADLYGWSRFDEARDIDFHSVLWKRSGGNVVVVVPSNVRVVVNSHVGVGATSLPGGVESDGFGRDIHTTYAPSATSSTVVTTGSLVVQIDLGAGHLEVQRA